MDSAKSAVSESTEKINNKTGNITYSFTVINISTVIFSHIAVNFYIRMCAVFPGL
jgi:hypothetical protein